MGNTKGKKNQFFLPFGCQKYYSQLWDVVDVQVDLIDSIADVHLEHLHGPQVRINEQYSPQYSIQGTTKLHGFLSGQRQCLYVNIREGVVNNLLWAAVLLCRKYSRVL